MIENISSKSVRNKVVNMHAIKTEFESRRRIDNED